MINPTLVLKILGERKEFVQNHPDFIAFILENFKNCNDEGTEIEVKIKRKNEVEQLGCLHIKKSDEKIMQDIKVLLEQITQ